MRRLAIGEMREKVTENYMTERQRRTKRESETMVLDDICVCLECFAYVNIGDKR
jgi:hypothetical protein